MSAHEEGFYYCLKHHRVEPYEGCADKHRLGPFPTADAAAHALETVAAREAQYEAEAAEEAADMDAPAGEDGDGRGQRL